MRIATTNGVDINAPKIGDEINGRLIGKHASLLYRWVACPDCGKQRWIAGKQGNYSGRCHSCGNRYAKRFGCKASRWNGGQLHRHDGYTWILLSPDDFFVSMATPRDRYIAEHRLVMAKYLGRCLHKWEVVHHKNGNKSDNRIGNLYLTMQQDHKLGYGQAFQDGYEMGYKQGLMDGRKKK